MNRPLVSLLLVAVLRTSAVAAGPETPELRRSVRGVDTVRIHSTSLPEGSTGVDVGPTLWSMQGFDLRALFGSVYLLNPARVDMRTTPAASTVEATQQEAARFDVSLALKGEETEDAIRAVLATALEQRFGVSARVETREAEVYVLTGPNGAGPNLHRTGASRVSAAAGALPEKDGSGELTVEGKVCPGVSSATMSGRAVTSAGIAAALEDTLEQPVVNETNLTGAYDFRLPEYRSLDELKSLLRDDLGVVLTRERRAIRMLVVERSPNSGETLHAGL